MADEMDTLTTQYHEVLCRRCRRWRWHGQTAPATRWPQRGSLLCVWPQSLHSLWRRYREQYAQLERVKSEIKASTCAVVPHHVVRCLRLGQAQLAAAGGVRRAAAQATADKRQQTAKRKLAALEGDVQRAVAEVRAGAAVTTSAPWYTRERRARAADALP